MISHIFHEENAYADKLVNFEFIYTKSFHWYKRLPSSMFLDFVINMYSFLMYHFNIWVFDIVFPYFCIFFLFLIIFFSCDDKCCQ